MAKEVVAGTIEFSERALCALVEHVTSQTYGVVDMTTASRTGQLAATIKRSPNRGVHAHFDDETHVTIYVNIIVNYGTNIASVSDSLINAIRYHVEGRTHLKVNQVNVHVQGVRMPSSE